MPTLRNQFHDRRYDAQGCALVSADAVATRQTSRGTARHNFCSRNVSLLVLFDHFATQLPASTPHGRPTSRAWRAAGQSVLMRTSRSDTSREASAAEGKPGRCATTSKLLPESSPETSKLATVSVAAGSWGMTLGPNLGTTRGSLGRVEIDRGVARERREVPERASSGISRRNGRRVIEFGQILEVSLYKSTTALVLHPLARHVVCNTGTTPALHWHFLSAGGRGATVAWQGATFPAGEAA